MVLMKMVIEMGLIAVTQNVANIFGTLSILQPLLALAAAKVI